MTKRELEARIEADKRALDELYKKEAKEFRESCEAALNKELAVRSDSGADFNSDRDLTAFVHGFRAGYVACFATMKEKTA